MRPVIVGIDPGRDGLHPLDPDYPSGTRLAGLAGLTPEEFRDAFDRVNLHAASGGASHETDSQSARNLAPILRGRRVVALGNVVSSSIGAPGRSLMWERGPLYVSATLPHPSGRNRWWNDPVNMDVAERFMKRLLKPCVHVEGADGSGKSTLVEYLAQDLDYIPSQDPPDSKDECWKRISDRVMPGIVCDRSSGLVSELVYGPVLRGGTYGPEEDYWRVIQSIAHAVTFVYCRPQRLRATFRDGELAEHVRGVKTRELELQQRYDDVMARISRMGARVIRYDWETTDPKEIARCVG